MKVKFVLPRPAIVVVGENVEERWSSIEFGPGEDPVLIIGADIKMGLDKADELINESTEDGVRLNDGDLLVNILSLKNLAEQVIGSASFAW